MKRLLALPVLLLLSACSMVPSLGKIGPTPTPTECGCTVKGTAVATPAGGLAPAGPAAPGANSTPAPAASGLDSYRDHWTAYTDPAGAFSFEYPAVYDSPDFGFCTVRQVSTLPDGAQAATSLGSRTQLTVYPAGGKDLQAAVEVWKADPAMKDAQYDPVKERTVGGVPALTLGYRSGGTNRFAESTFFVRDGLLYRVDTGVPSACDVSALNLKELDAYSHVLDSFQFK